MRPKHLFAILVLLAFALPASPAQAGGVVTECTEAGLLAALTGGGTVTFACSGTITLTGTLDIAADTTINGSGQAVTLSGDNAFGVFYVNSGIRLSLNELTVADGSSSPVGGGIYNNGGILSVTNTTFSGNSAGDYGGGIYSYGTLTVTNSAFTGNSADWGGGIFTDGGVITVTNSTFSGNSADYAGGGIFTTGGVITVTNSTFSGNSVLSDYGGGGIFNEGAFTVTNSTFSGNSAPTGGGLYNWSGTLSLANTIVADSLGGNCYGTITDEGGNLSYPVEDTSCPADIRGDPLLAPLHDNGGPTETMTLGAGSPAIDAGIPSSCPGTDQRGVTRPIDGDEDGDAICDIGAFEYEPAATVTTLTADDPDPSQAAGPFTVAFSVTSTLEVPTGVVTITVSDSPASCSAVLVDGAGSCELAIAASGAYILTASYDGAYFLPSSDTEPHTVIADTGGVVSVCDEAHLRAALPVGTVTFACSGEIILASTIDITADTTIDGSGQAVTISGDNAVRVFYVNSGISLSLNELTVADGSSSPVGGGIYNNGGILNISDSAFSGNSASAGGGIFTYGGILTVSDSTFSANSASDGAGGGIYNVGGDVVVGSGTSPGRRADTSSGSIIDAVGGVITVTNTTFSGNSATGVNGIGGGIYSSGTLIVTNSTFFGNSARGGGGIENDGTVVVTNTTFSGNSASWEEYGGGIDNDSGVITVTNSTFYGNSSGGGGGGGIYNAGDTVSLANTIVTDSSGGNCGGTITDEGGNLSYPVEDTSCPADIRGDPLLGPLQDNGGPTETMALSPSSPAIDAGVPSSCPDTDQRGVTRPIDGDGNGDAICDIGSFEFQHPTVTTFTADDPDPSQAAGPFTVAFSVASTTTLETPTGVVTVTVSDSPASCSASLVDGSGSCELAIAESGAYTLTAEYSGAESFLPSSDTELHTVIADTGGVVSVCDEAHLRAALPVGTVTFACSGTITLSGTIEITEDTTMDGSGHAVILSGDNAFRVFYVHPGIRLSLIGLTVADGSNLDRGGGGVFNDGGILAVRDSTFSGNSVGAYGGGIFTVGGVITVTNTTFSGNSAGWGGGIFSEGGTLSVINSTFSGNSADYWGGAIFNASGDFTVINTTFSGNSAGDYGGGGIINERGAFTVIDSTFSGNSADLDGGGIYNAGTLTVSSSTFSSNSADDAVGGILTVSSSTFSGNSAGEYGGGIYTDGGVITVTNSTFSSNSAVSGGGGIFNEGGVTVINSTFTGNSAPTGGGLYNYIGTLSIANTIVANSPTGGNCAGTITDEGGNLSYPIADTSCPADIRGDPLLGPLQDNDGPTETMALGAGSPAIDAADDALCAAPPVNNLDQRGVTRPIDGDRDGIAHCDIGAFEYQHATVTTITADDPDPSQAGEPFTVAFSVTSTFEVPTGVVTVTVSDSTATCSAVLVDGSGSCALAIAEPGTYILTASFEGLGSFASSRDTEPHSVVPATRELYMPMVWNRTVLVTEVARWTRK